MIGDVCMYEHVGEYIWLEMYVCLLWFVTYDWICMYVVMFGLHMLERYVFVA